MILVFTEKITSRIRYIFRLCLDELLGLEYRITQDQEEFSGFEGPRFTYSRTPADEGLFFASHPLLLERGIRNQEPGFTRWNDEPALFPVHHPRSVMPFDPFAASFYLASRYEEYLPYIKDEHGRFSATESIAGKYRFLEKPVVNIWMKKVGEILRQSFPGLPFKKRPYSFIPTIDVDAAYAYRNKGIVRTTVGYINSLRQGDFKSVRERTRVLAGWQDDPYDSFGFQMEIHKANHLRPVYFILFAGYDRYDKNIPVQNLRFRKLVKTLADYADIGIHPSYASADDFKKLKKETESLSKLVNISIGRSRQHFLRISFPETYRNLIHLDITDDFSMGYGSRPGFRAGICNSFHFFDLDLDAETPLRIHPFTFMDGALKDHLKLSPREAMNYIKPLIDLVKSVNGTFIPLWHNDALGTGNAWSGWRNVYADMITEALKNP